MHGSLVPGRSKAQMEPMELVAPHGANKQPRNLYKHWNPDPLGRLVKETVVEQLYLADWIRQSHRLQLTFRRRCERRWEKQSAFCIWLEGWVLLRPPGQLALLRKFLWFDPDFGWATFLAACLRVLPALEEMD